MRTVAGLALIALAATAAFGQRAGSLTREQPGTNHGNAQGAAGGPRFPRGPGFARPVFPLYPAAYDYGYPPGYDYNYAPGPTVVIVPPPPPYVVVQEAPPPIVRPEIREYQPPSFQPTTGEEPPSFSIALKDGSVHSAVAVAVDNDTVRYVDPDGAHQSVALGAVDREATARLNRARNLQLRLPASPR